MGVCSGIFFQLVFLYFLKKSKFPNKKFSKKKKSLIFLLLIAYNNVIVISVVTRRETNHIFKIFVESLWNFFVICLTD